jgi:BirA family biotin operon repressor/biotin-[acetyl-CoA-carboxylase] ligase
MSKRLNPARLQQNLKTKLLGRTIFYSRTVTSTNAWAKKLADQGAPEGTVTIAETQTHGRGRLRRKWVSPVGGLWFSVILRPKLGLTEALKLTFVACLAVAETLEEQYGIRTEIKWPNDVLVNRQKICGVLGQTSTAGKEVNTVVLGIGINANFDAQLVLPQSIRAAATSLKTQLNHNILLEELFNRILEKLEATYMLYTRHGFSPILKEWKKRAHFLGQEVEVKNRNEMITGLAYDVDQDGSLILILKNGTQEQVYTGDMSPRTKQSN